MIFFNSGRACNYYSISIYLFGFGLLLLYYFRDSIFVAFVAGIIHGGTILCYPPQIVSCAVSGIIYGFHISQKGLRNLVFYITGGILIGFSFLLYIGLDGFNDIYTYTQSLGYTKPTFRFFRSIEIFIRTPTT